MGFKTSPELYDDIQYMDMPVGWLINLNKYTLKVHNVDEKIKVCIHMPDVRMDNQFRDLILSLASLTLVYEIGKVVK